MFKLAELIAYKKQLEKETFEKIASLQKTSNVLTEQGRDRIKGSNFALPGRKYPIENEEHARNALARVQQFGTPAEQAIVKAKVYKKYPALLVRKATK